MIRLHITAEGHAEQAFAKTVLAPHLAKFSVFADARCVLTSKDKRGAKEYRGGLVSYEKAKNDIQNWLKEDNHYQIVFWSDTAQELRAEYEALELPEGEKLELINNEYQVKYRVLREHPEQKFLLYRDGLPPVDGE